MNAQICNTAPLHQFKQFVVERLQKRWPGRAGWDLFRKFEAEAEAQWAAGVSVDEVADFIHKSFLSRPVKPVQLPTKKGLQAAGCVWR